MTKIEIDKNLKQYGNTHKVPITFDDTLCFLCETINKHSCKTVLEIGTAIAYGTITMAENTNLQHIDSVEIDEERFAIATQNVAKHNLTNKISLFNCDAMDYIKNCKSKYDFIYLDGPKGQYINYLPYLVEMLNINGILVADNLYFHGMVTGTIPTTKGCRAMIKGLKKYIQAIKTHPDLNTTILDIGDGIGVCIKKCEQ